MPTLSDWYTAALGVPPYPYQQRLAAEDWPDVLKIPTGLGKTAAIFFAWLYKRHCNDVHTPRRLVWCLPMRVLAEQTARLARQWGERLVSAGLLSRAPAVHVLMGGDVAQDWDTRPEDEAVLIGTQDQLLSRALNRGYAMSRFRWPLDFALLHNDAFWIFDEVQLMGAGLPTSTQLEAFRRRFACAVPCRSLWCSATLHPRWLASVDFAAHCPAPRLAELQEDDTGFPQVRQRIHAGKQVLPLAGADNSKQLADAVLAEHRPETLTLVIRNRVRDAVELFETLRKRKNTPPLCLLHSRFRPADRAVVLQAALAAPDGEGRIVVTTQVVEAGVDISAATLFTDIAPWASLVQRFGRCNRAGERRDARIFWLDKSVGREQDARPYTLDELNTARQRLAALENAAPALLPDTDAATAAYAVLRAPDLFDLFDTTPDLAGADIDVSRFIRESDDSDVQVFWRSWPGNAPPPDMPGPRGIVFRAAGRRAVLLPERQLSGLVLGYAGRRMAQGGPAASRHGSAVQRHGRRLQPPCGLESRFQRNCSRHISKRRKDRCRATSGAGRRSPQPCGAAESAGTWRAHYGRAARPACGAGQSRSAFLSAVAAHGGAAARLGQGAPRLSVGLHACRRLGYLGQSAAHGAL